MLATIGDMRIWPLILLLAASPAIAQKKPFDVQAMLRMTRLSEPQISPDGKLIAFTAQTIDLDKEHQAQAHLCGAGRRWRAAADHS